MAHLNRRRVLVPGLTALAALSASGGAVVVLGTTGGPAAAASSTPKAAGCKATTPKLTVSGTGIVSSAPNELVLSLDVHNKAISAKRALAANNTTATAVVHAIEAHGVTKREIQTTNLTISPDFSNKGAVTGYTVDNTVTVTMHDFAAAGGVIDAAVAVGGNATRIDSLTFSLSNPEAAQSRARTMAVHQAVSHAHVIARSAGERLGGICSMHDTTTTVTSIVTPLPGTHVPVGFAATGAPSAPVEPGNQTVTASVSIVYALSRG